MPGSPATSPNFGAARYADGDDATFSAQVNSVTDTFDSLAVRKDDPRLADARAPLPGSVAGGAIPNASIIGQQIAPQTITETNMAPSSIGSPELIDGSIQTVDLADGSVTHAKLAPGTIQTSDLANGQVTTAKLDTPTQQALNVAGDLVWSAAAARVGCVLCDGRAVGRTDPVYTALYAAIGTTYGAGDGSTTFNVPDIRGRVMVGAGTAGTGLTARALNAKFGEEAHVITLAEMAGHDHGTWTGGMNQNNPHAHSIYDPGHAHSISDPGHAHTYYSGGSHAVNVYNGSGAAWTAAGTSAVGDAAAGTGIGIYGAGTGIGIYNTDINHSHQIPAQGSNAAHNNMQPSIGINCFVKL